MVEKTAPDTNRDGTERARAADSRANSAEGSAKQATDYRVLDVRESDVVLELEDGRAFIATLGEGVDKEGIRRGMRATITSDGLDRSEAPKDAVVTRVAPKE